VALILRPYSSVDFDDLFQLDQICYPRGIAYSKRTLRQYLAIPGAICIVAENNQDGRITGFIVAESAPPEAHIITLDVDPAARRQHTGSQLYVAIEAQLAARGVREIMLETATDNAAAVAFWTRHGYLSAGVIRNYYLRNVDAYYMIKHIAHKPAA
jgi:[ribosomal protein S18]-alanine N-acetyltransferase